MLGLDVGGANLKIATDLGVCRSQAFPLWRQPEQLAAALYELVAHMPADNRVALTMTGELADCYPTKAAGVRHIVAAVQEAIGDRALRVYLVDGSFVTATAAVGRPLAAAASNWHALAACVARQWIPEGEGLLLDIGSTTADIVPLARGQVVAMGTTDPARLAAGELVYTGVERTPMFAVLGACDVGGIRYPTIPEWFATAQDAYLLTGDCPPDPHNRQTADGQPAIASAAHARVARIVGADATLITLEQATQISQQFAAAQVELLCRHAARVAARLPGRVERVVTSGQGEFVARRVVQALQLDERCVSLSELASSAASRCGPAWAVAWLAARCEAW
jgi:(4-(4-[2-(gamma-L-glutamylamino)ethyl]phenoxymethyl)furan-2-yl)methanamine synthase